ncbi:MAG: hypothetical protein M1823_008176, partial [Watsoniomyces obsoletus]
PSVNDLTAAPEDSVLTTASTMTQGGRKSKAKKATASKTQKTRAKKAEPAEVTEPLEEVEPMLPPPKATRGKKRGSDAVDESILSRAEAPAPKRRATRTKGGPMAESSMMEADDADVLEAPAPKKTAGRKKAQAPTDTRSIQISENVSVISPASTRGAPGAFPDDDEIERQLQAELDMQMSEEDEIAADS